MFPSLHFPLFLSHPFHQIRLITLSSSSPPQRYSRPSFSLHTHILRYLLLRRMVCLTPLHTHPAVTLAPTSALTSPTPLPLPSSLSSSFSRGASSVWDSALYWLDHDQISVTIMMPIIITIISLFITMGLYCASCLGYYLITRIYPVDLRH